jgi:hypothetical protein
MLTDTHVVVQPPFYWGTTAILYWYSGTSVIPGCCTGVILEGALAPEESPKQGTTTLLTHKNSPPHHFTKNYEDFSRSRLLFLTIGL